MLSTERRVVITGLGLVSPVGIGLDAYWTSLAEGRGGLDHIRAFRVEDLPNDIGGGSGASWMWPGSAVQGRSRLGSRGLTGPPLR